MRAVRRGRVVLATAAVGIEYDIDLPLMVDALRARGLDATAVPWDAEGYDWSAADCVVIRSTWNYGDRSAAYLSWADRVGAVTRLHNAAGLIRWNIDKRYLGDLADRGVPTVPTTFLAPGDAIALPGRGEYVVKPTVSSGARDTARYAEGPTGAARRHVAALHAAGATVMVQPYLPRIAEGERALVFFGGVLSHALRKGPVLTDIGVVDNARVAHPDLRTHRPTPAETALATAALDAIPGQDRPLVARVDMALADDGSPVLMELELIEPNLFIAYSTDGLRHFTDAVERAVRAVPA
ncbi:hypothetical protein [Streptomyces sp. NPDC093109]|uniref:ATP-grasp domain-containing protein n=1 Tax=Streptomyces sp. NPDC093109 TaxID=3154977 RepID=UPI00344DCF15